ncbi:MAG: hypothetical protein AAF417_23425 [Pseudomonadota bacterium]
MSAFLIVRAEVADEAHRKDFDTWYENEHLPDAVAAFNAEGATRGWSDVDPSVHYAFYRFPDLATAQSIGSSDEIAALIKEFDRLWDGKVVRTRDIVEIINTIEA